MRSSIFTVFALSSILGLGTLVGCAADAQRGDEEGDAPETMQADALSKTGKLIVGSYKTVAPQPTFEIKADGTYTWDTGIRCIRTPCPSGDAGKWTIYTGTYGRKYVNLVSKPKGQDRWFRIYDGPPVVLEGRFGTDGTFTKDAPVITPCATVRCAAGYVCDDSTGTAQCVKDPATTCAAVLCGPGTFCDESTGTAKCIGYRTCENTKVACEVGTHCENTSIVCVKAPCPPTAPSCVPSSKDFCNVDADCKLVDDYCGGCNCLGLATWAKPPSCTDPVACLVAPCGRKTVACEKNHCVVR